MKIIEVKVPLTEKLDFIKDHTDVGREYIQDTLPWALLRGDCYKTQYEQRL